MKNKNKPIKALAWVLSCAIFGAFLYGVFNYVTGITVYPNNENLVRSYEKLQSSFRDENYIFPDLSELDSGNNKYGIIMDGSTLRSKPQTFFVEVTYPHEICNIRYQVISYLSAYDEAELPGSVRGRSAFLETEYKNIPIHILDTCYDSANSIEYYFSLDEHHYSVGANYYTDKQLDSQNQEGTLTQAEQQEVEKVIYAEAEKIVHQMIDTVITEPYAEIANSEVPEAIIIPTVDEVRANGYPTNENGETYGPMVWEWTMTPDLSLVIADDGREGYVRNSEMDDGVTTLEDAINHKPENRVLNVYLHDGVTVIGTFTLGGD